MPLPFRKPSAALPTWISELLWKEIESTGTDVFLAASSPRLRLERWGSTLRALATQPDPLACEEQLVTPPVCVWSAGVPRCVLWLSNPIR